MAKIKENVKALGKELQAFRRDIIGLERHAQAWGRHGRGTSGGRRGRSRGSPSPKKSGKKTLTVVPSASVIKDKKKK